MTILELLTVVGVIGVMVALAIPRMDEWFSHQRAKNAARELANAFTRARAESMRTGNHFIVFFGPPGTTDGNGTPIEDANGDFVPVMILDDGTPATANCRIDVGETREVLYPVAGLNWGVTNAGAKVSTDSGGAALSGGITFEDPTNTAMNWVLFRPDGIPVAFTTNAGVCNTIYNAGTGGGALYITNGDRDYGVVVTKLGGVKVHVWNGTGWSS